MEEHLKANRPCRRVVVTGIGLVSPVGIGTDATWDAIVAGTPGVGPITLFNTEHFTSKIAGEVKGFDPGKYLDHKDVKKTARFTQFAMAATQFALEQAKLEITPDIAPRVGVYVGSGIGGFEVIEREHDKLQEHGPKRVSPFFYHGDDCESGGWANLHPLRAPQGPHFGVRYSVYQPARTRSAKHSA